jgi:hypothetical protein
MASEAASAQEQGSYVGWVAAAIVLLVTFSAAAGVWFIFHP